MLYEFPEYLPDLPDYGNPGATEAKNVVPAGKSYESLNNLVSTSTAIDNYFRGGIASRNPTDGVEENYVGDGTKLYRLDQGAFTDVSQATYALSEDERWDFTQFGAKVIATAINEEMQAVTLGSSSTFSDLATSAPRARYVDVIRDFVVVGNVEDTSGVRVPNRVQWCAIGDSTDWVTSPTTQADSQDLPADHGGVKRVIGGETGIILQENAITRMNYVGSPVIFQFTTVEVNKGTRYPWSVIQVGNLLFYMGKDGFYVFDGSQSVPIGVNKIDRTLFDSINTSFPDRVSAEVDVDKHVIAWSVPTTNSADGTPDRIIFYNYSPNAKRRWSYADITLQGLFKSSSEGFTLDGLDDYQIANKDPSSSTASAVNIDLLPVTLDSRFWIGNNFIFGAFDENNRLAEFTGDALTAVMETAEVQPYPGQRAEVDLVKPLVQGDSSTSITMQVGVRDELVDDVSYGASVAVNAIGQCPVTTNSRYLRLRTTISGGFNHAIGVELLESNPGGYR